jgi:hypothetical protein
MNILEDYEFGMLDAPMVRRGEVHHYPKQPVTTTTAADNSVELGGQHGEFFPTGDMLDPTIMTNTTVSPPPAATVIAGSVAFLALFLIAYKRMYFHRRHAHADDDPLLPTTTSS